jgi:putative membrane protein
MTGLSLGHLPALNAALNGLSALLLASGYLCVRRRKVTAHKICMGSAFAIFTLFLLSYLTYHAHVGSVPFRGQGWIRSVYFAILISHTTLAATILPLALVTLSRALRGQFARHVRVARWTLPLWLYVSVTGVVVYWMLYHLSPRL